MIKYLISLLLLTGCYTFEEAVIVTPPSTVGEQLVPEQYRIPDGGVVSFIIDLSEYKGEAVAQANADKFCRTHLHPGAKAIYKQTKYMDNNIVIRYECWLVFTTMQGVQ